jgi:hypothetical protein
MMFNLEADLGDRISLYVVPDSFTGSCRVEVSSDGRALLDLMADEPRPALVAGGRHATGLCGLTLTEAEIAGLAGLGDLEIRDVETGILVYRRRPPGAVEGKRVLRIETHLLPLWRLDDALRPHFHYFGRSIERHGLETATQCFHLNAVASAYLSGRIAYRSFEIFIDKAGVTPVIVLHEPFHELAERLVVLRQFSIRGSDFLSERDAIAFGAAITFARDLPFDDSRALGRRLRGMPPDVEQVLSDPLVRQLSTQHASEPLTQSSLATALAALAGCSLVGLRERHAEFADGLAELVGIDSALLPGVPPMQSVAALAGTLRSIPWVERLVERDLELYGHVAAAFARSAADADTGR